MRLAVRRCFSRRGGPLRRHAALPGMIPSDRRAELAHDAAARPAAESRGARLRSRLRARDQLEHGLLRRRGDTGELGAISTLVLGWRASSRICSFSSAVHVRLVFFASVLSPMQGPAPPGQETSVTRSPPPTVRFRLNHCRRTR